MAIKTKFNSGDRVKCLVNTFIPGAVGVISSLSFENGQNPNKGGYIVEFDGIKSRQRVLLFEDELELAEDEGTKY